MKMKKVTVPMLVAFAVSLTALPATWGQGGEEFDQLTGQCQNVVATQPETEAAQLCQEGIQLLQEGRTEEAVATMKKGLARAEG